MITFFRELPSWALAHPWAVAGWIIVALAAPTALILCNPNDRQARSFFRRRK